MASEGVPSRRVQAAVRERVRLGRDPRLHHARKLAVHEYALKAGWDRVHHTLGITQRFYDWFTRRSARAIRLAGRAARSRAGISWPSAGPEDRPFGG